MIKAGSAAAPFRGGTAHLLQLPKLSQILLTKQLQLNLNSHDTTIPDSSHFTLLERRLLSSILHPGRFSQRGRRPGQSHSRLTSRLHGPGGISTPGSAAVRHGLRLEVQS